MKLPLFYYIIILCSIIFSRSQIVASEEPQYTILKKSDNIEVRQYDEYIVAETIVTGDFEDVSNEGFRRLVGYIGGENIKKEEIEINKLPDVPDNL